MISETGFRAVLGSSIAAGLVAIIVAILSEAFLPIMLQQYVFTQAASPMSARMLVAFLIWVPAVVITLVAAVGMYFFWRPARVLALIGTLLALAALPFYEPTVETGLAIFFNEGASILWGMVLAIAYWSPLAQRFGQSGVAK